MARFTGQVNFWSLHVLLNFAEMFSIFSTKAWFFAGLATIKDAPAVRASVNLIWEYFIHPRIPKDNAVLEMPLFGIMIILGRLATNL